MLKYMYTAYCSQVVIILTLNESGTCKQESSNFANLLESSNQLCACINEMMCFLNELRDQLLIYATSIFDSKESLAHKKLEIAIKYSNISYLKKIIKMENIKNIDEALLHKDCDKTILMLACEEGNLESVKVLLDNNADPNALFKGSGLYYACLSGNLDLIKYMLIRGIEIDDEIIFNCLFKSTHSKILNNRELVTLLLSHVRDINNVTNDGIVTYYTYYTVLVKLAYLVLSDIC